MDNQLQYIHDLFPNAQCELNYKSLFQLLIAVVLSAQTTDKSVNRVTAVLFAKYPDAPSLKNANLQDVEQILNSIGMYKIKSKNIIAIAKMVDEKFFNTIPSDPNLLSLLPGVGTKTINVVLAEGFKIPAFPVDTHINRIAKRLNYAHINDNVQVVEEKLKKVIAKEDWIQMHHSLIFFGRYFCKAKQPLCEQCKLSQQCHKAYK